jgi:hypothetical protein
MELTASLTTLGLETAQSLKGSARQRFMARTVQARGPGGQRWAERALGWNRGPLRHGTQELPSGCPCRDAFSAQGRTRAEDQLPHLLSALQALVARQSPAEPPLRPTRLYTRLSAAEGRRQRIARQGSLPAALPPVQSITTKRNNLGALPKKGATRQPQNKCPTPRRSSPR